MKPPDVIWVIRRFWDNEDKVGWFTGTVEDKSDDKRWHKYHLAPEWVSVEELTLHTEKENDNYKLEVSDWVIIKEPMPGDTRYIWARIERSWWGMNTMETKWVENSWHYDAGEWPYDRVKYCLPFSLPPCPSDGQEDDNE